MRVMHPVLGPCLSIAVAACVGPAGRPSFANLLQDAPSDVAARFELAGDHLVAAAVPLGPGSLPAAVRTTFDAIAPGGRTTFVGRESGGRGEGYRLEKAYTEGATTRTRSVLAAADGSVLERWHSVAIAEVPQQVLTVALRTGPTIEDARIVSGPEREEHWTFVVRDRGGRTFVVEVGLAGEPLGRRRRTNAVVEG